MKYRNPYYYEKRGHGNHYRRSYSHPSSPESKSKNKDFDKKSKLQDSSKVNSAPKNNKQESVKDQNEKNSKALKTKTENKTRMKTPKMKYA